MGVCGALALSMRYSAIVWLVTLLPLVWWRVARGRRGFSLAVAGLWGVVGAVHGERILAYVTRKQAGLAAYAAMHGSLLKGVWTFAGLPLLVLVGIGLVAVPWNRRPRGFVWVLLSWVLVPPGLSVLFAVGLEDFVVWGVGLAVLAGWGLSRLRWWGPALCVTLFLLHHVPQYQPFGWGRSPCRGGQLFARLMQIEVRGPGGHYLPSRNSGHGGVAGLIRSGCPAVPTRCNVVVDHNLFRPWMASELPATEALLARLDNVRFHLLVEPDAGCQAFDPLQTKAHILVLFNNSGPRRSRSRPRCRKECRKVLSLLLMKGGMVRTETRTLDRRALGSQTWYVRAGGPRAGRRAGSTGAGSTRAGDGTGRGAARSH